MTDLYTNHNNCLHIADAVKQKNPQVKIILGGPNAAMLGDLVLRNRPVIDYVVGSSRCWDGEDALTGLINETPEAKIPNLWYKKAGKAIFTYPAWTDLKSMPLWDFADFLDLDVRLAEHINNQAGDPWQVSPLALFNLRGCIKAIKEGPCTYCTSADCGGKGRLLLPDQFWQQVTHLNQLYGAKVFYVADDIFTVSLATMERLARAKPSKDDVKLRAYGFLPDLIKLENKKLKRMATALKKIGVFNLFYGSEHYAPAIVRLANKQPVSIQETVRIMNYLYIESGVKTTIAIKTPITTMSIIVFFVKIFSFGFNFRSIQKKSHKTNKLEKPKWFLLNPCSTQSGWLPIPKKESVNGSISMRCSKKESA